jgi:hypothetical protein
VTPTACHRVAPAVTTHDLTVARQSLGSFYRSFSSAGSSPLLLALSKY